MLSMHYKNNLNLNQLVLGCAWCEPDERSDHCMLITGLASKVLCLSIATSHSRVMDYHNVTPSSDDRGKPADQKSDVPIMSWPPLWWGCCCCCWCCWWCGRELACTGPWCLDGIARPRFWSSSATMCNTLDWAGLKDFATPWPSPVILHIHTESK